MDDLSGLFADVADVLGIGTISIVEKDYYTLWISRCFATARERIPGSIDNYVTGVSERSQQRGNLKDNGYNLFSYFSEHSVDRKLDLKKPPIFIQELSVVM
ncbi:hypothetical protein [Photorhabdus africana]|uniref:hypothetical protein n=1 Tax=Photorhabdus africana TaxID=3097554 RepID=UPI002B415229|nr:hypothetical protein [Photorhabdus sp. CRI-LC]